MKKNLLLLAAATLALAGCSNDEYLGTAPTGAPEGHGGAITFSGLPSNISRATQTGDAAANLLGKKFQVYGTKNTGSEDVNVFAQGIHSTTTNTPYWVWRSATLSNTNTNSWEYAGAANAGGTGVPATAQEIKYWDHAADHYDFIAFSATAGGDVTNVKSDGFTFTGTATELAGLYIADKVVVTGSANYNKLVTFTFRSAAAKVRVGIYETVEGYQVRNFKFRPLASEFTASTSNAILSGTFLGSTGDLVSTITIADANGSKAVIDQTGTSTTKHFDFGTFGQTDVAVGEASTSPTLTSYVTTTPNLNNTGDMTLVVDYELYNTTTQEVIKVSKATAVVPAEFMTWENNHAYTYLFKVSQKTNGSTNGDDGVQGLTAITFDAKVESDMVIEDENQEGTITTIATPSITTYQDGSVVANGVEYKAGTIEIAIVENSTEVDLTTTNPEVYIVTGVTTEADLALIDYTTIASSKQSVSDVASSNRVSFTAVANTNYAVVYTDASNEKHYKFIEVAAAP